MATKSTNIVEILLSVKDQGSDNLRRFAANLGDVEKQSLKISAAVGAASAGIVIGLTHATIVGARFSDQIDDLASRTLTSRETIEALGLSLARTGDDFLGSEVAVRTYNRALIDAVSGQQTTLRAFSALGLSIDDLTGPGGKLRSFEDILPIIAERFSHIDDEATRVDVAMTLFGRSGTAMIPALMGGAAGIENLRRKSSELIPVSAEAARKLSEVDDGASDLRIGFRGLQSSIAVGLAPAVSGLISQLTDAVTGLSRFAAEHPQVTAAVGTVTAAIAGGAGLIASLVAGQKALSKLTTIGTAAGLSLRSLAIATPITAAIVSLAAAAGFAADAMSNLKGAENDHRAALQEHGKLLEDTSRDMTELARVEKELTESANRHSEARMKLNLELSQLFTIATHKPVLMNIIPELKIDPKSVTDQLPMMWTRAGAVARLAAERQQPVTITVPVQATGLDADLTRARAELRSMVEEERSATEALHALTASPAAAADAVIEASQKQKEAHEKTGAAALNVAELEKRLADENRAAAKSMDDLRVSILALDVAAGRSSMEDLLTAEQAALMKSEAALDRARAAADAATPGTEAYRDAQKKLTEAVQDYDRASGNVDDTLRTMKEQLDSARQGLLDNREAWDRLADAQARAGLAKMPRSGNRDEQEQVEGRAEAARDLAQAQADYNEVLAAGPPTLDAQTAGINALADAQDRVNASLDETEGKAELAAAAVNAIGGAIGALAGESGRAITQVVHLIEQIIRLQTLHGATKTLGVLGIVGSIVGVFAGLQGGGTVRSGQRGVDSNVVRLGRDETVVDHSLTDELRSFLRTARTAPVASTGPSVVQVSFPSTINVSSRDAMRKAGRLVSDVTDRYFRETVFSPTR